MRIALSLIICAIALGAASQPAAANWLTKLAREAGEGGADAAHLPSAIKLSPIGKAASHLATSKSSPPAALAAHATPAGHWQFANREGQLFTAATPDEMQRVVPSLLPDVAESGRARLSLYVSQDSFFGNRQSLSDLSKNADLHIVTDEGVFPIVRNAHADAPAMAKMRPNLSMALTDAKLLEEAASFLSRPLKRAGVRPLSVTASGPKSLPSAPRIDVSTNLPDVDFLGVQNLTSGFQSLRGQTAILTGRLENDVIAFSGAGERRLEELAAAAKENDVSLIVLHAPSGGQPGTRNWLWQTTSIDGLAEAAAKTSMGDFLDTLAASQNGMTLTAARDGIGRIRITVRPDPDVSAIAGAKGALGGAVEQVTGKIVQAGAEIYTRDRANEEERALRLIPFLPSTPQILYLMAMVAGVLSFSTARSWWRGLKPAEPAREGVGVARRFVRALPYEMAFLLIFLPLLGPFALVFQTVRQIWVVATAPFIWLRRKLTRQAG